MQSLIWALYSGAIISNLQRRRRGGGGGLTCFFFFLRPTTRHDFHIPSVTFRPDLSTGAKGSSSVLKGSQVVVDEMKLSL